MILFVDRDLGGKQLVGALRAVHVEVTGCAERYVESDTEKVPDTQWIREASALGEVIITRDRGIQRRPAEIEAVVEAGAKGFIMETGNATPFWNLRALLLAWPAMERLVGEESAPFLFGIRPDGRMIRRYPKESVDPVLASPATRRAPR